MDAATTELRDVLLEARALLARPDNNFDWSWWRDAQEALRAVDRQIAALERGWPAAARELFAPTGPMQEVSISSGWADEFLALAERFDAAMEAHRNRGPWWRRLLHRSLG